MNSFESVMNSPEQPKEVHPTDKNILHVCKKLKEGLFDFVIAGGYARDKYYGLLPKDCDICVFNFHPEDAAEAALLEQFLNHMKHFTDVEVHGEYDGSDGRLGDVIKLPEWNIDIIFYRSASCAFDVMTQFDCNLNQAFILSSIPSKFYSPELSNIRWLHGVPPKQLHFLTEDLSLARIEHMFLKWHLCTGLTAGSEAIEFRQRLAKKLQPFDDEAEMDTPW
ncbi:MAG: hypothetical protein [Caudoviricetes sp.]|nr:MAG: hypothetical protein [Caudoviricetes sp.]